MLTPDSQIESRLPFSTPGERAFQEMLAHTPYLYAESPGLASNLMVTGLTGTLHALEPDSPLLLLRRFIAATAAPNSMYLLYSSEGGETTLKTERLRALFSPIIDQAPAFADRVWHLMCYAGKDGKGNPLLLNTVKPAFSNASRSPLLMKTGEGGGSGHLVLNKEAAARRFDGFEPMGEDELRSLTGMVRHGVNFLLRGARYDDHLEMRCVFDSTLYEMYLQANASEIHFIEVPLGEEGSNHSENYFHEIIDRILKT